MQDFMFKAETQLWFGRTALDHLADSVKEYDGRGVLMVYGGGSIKKNGLYDKIVKIFNDNNIRFMELPGVSPNPKMALVREGLKIVKENDLNIVLAVGGGSCVDTAKAIATNYYFDDDISKLIGQWWLGPVLPVFVVSTMSGAGTEMTTSAVLNNEDKKEKKGFHGPNVRPRVTFLDPTNVFTAPPKQTAAGIADGISHTFESYFSNEKGAYLHARFSDAVLKTLFKYGPIAYNEPENYEARANVMLACTWACNGFNVKGNYVMWSCHLLEHQLSAYDDKITHGEGLAILTPAWMRWALSEERAYRYVEMAENVFGISHEGKTDMEMAELCIEKVEDFFFNKLHMPRRLRDLGIPEDALEGFAAPLNSAPDNVKDIMFKRMDASDALEILKACY